MTRIRTNAHPVILASLNERRGGAGSGSRSTNVILDLARDLDSGDTYSEALEILWATQVLRVAYDSPRIGGGIDPAIASNVPSLEDAVAEGGLIAYIVGDPQADPTNCLEGYSDDEIQDMIVHAEAVASGLIRQAELSGTAY